MFVPNDPYVLNDPYVKILYLMIPMQKFYT